MGKHGYMLFMESLLSHIDSFLMRLNRINKRGHLLKTMCSPFFKEKSFRNGRVDLKLFILQLTKCDNLYKEGNIWMRNTKEC